jgi:hypothetical protein
MFAPAYMGRIRCFSNAFTPSITAQSVERKLWRGFAHLIQFVYALANMGHPASFQVGFVRLELVLPQRVHTPLHDQDRNNGNHGSCHQVVAG